MNNYDVADQDEDSVLTRLCIFKSNNGALDSSNLSLRSNNVYERNARHITDWINDTAKRMPKSEKTSFLFSFMETLNEKVMWTTTLTTDFQVRIPISILLWYRTTGTEIQY